MKIGFVLDDRLDKPDGVQQYVQLVGSWLNSQGHEVHYLVGDSPRALQKNVHSLSKTINVRFNKNRMAMPLPASKKKIALLLKHEQFDVLHVQMPYSPLLAGRVVASAPTRTTVVGTFHILPHGNASSIGTKLLGVVLKNNKKRFDGFLSVSSAAQVFAKSHFGIESTVLPNVVDLQLFSKGIAIKKYNNKPNIVFLGRFVERKGAQFALDAYKQLLELYDAPLRLILCGDGPDKAKLTQRANAITHHHKDIVFTGFLKESEKSNYLATADIAVFPSTGGESFGIVLIEAMASGSKVVIGGDNSGYTTVLGDQPNTLVHPQDTDQFAQRLLLLLKDNKLAGQIHEQQQNLVKKYDITYVGPKIVAFYEKHLHNSAKKDVKNV
ncbi:glycosyltransferase family 1 protein [bacterium]|nr:glycosyltransferase family 1 protein [bacterium]NBX98656.1 glycosyltransferase family 1 protein [bacterium]NDC94093.1 glycosyltransferase family 1 protein [bacterium]NDD83539.1 glycosyltransferase family 1 protein [bacterium]NDG29340.1 glycosyltransferase family 1 protein [bacterium]